MADDAGVLTRPDLYDTDFFAWAQQQAAALRARDAGANGLDYDNLAEEVEDLGKSVLRACRSHVRLIIEHLIKLEFAEAPLDRLHWRRELAVFRRDLNELLTATLGAALRPEITTLFDEQLEDLIFRQYRIDAARVRAQRPEGYTWQQITDPSWAPRD